MDANVAAASTGAGAAATGAGARATIGAGTALVTGAAAALTATGAAAIAATAGCGAVARPVSAAPPSRRISSYVLAFSISGKARGGTEISASAYDLPLIANCACSRGSQPDRSSAPYSAAPTGGL